MVGSIDFVLPSCYYIPESMWLVVTAMLETIRNRCWILLGAFVVIKMLVSAFVDLGEGRLSLASQIKIVAQTFLIAVFLIYYKTFLMTFDYMIDSLCFFKPEVVEHVREEAASVVRDENWLFRGIYHIIGLVGSSLFFLTQQGASAFMQYVRSVSLLVLAVLGPLSALFSLLPGPFKASFSTWSRGYVNVTCWTITLAIIDVLEAAFTFETNLRIPSILLSAALFVVTFFVPTWTAKLISSVELGNIVAGMGSGPLTAYKTGKDLFSSKKS